LEYAVRKIRKLAVLAILDPAFPVLETFLGGDDLRTGNIVLDVVVQEVVAVLLANTTRSVGTAPLVTANLEYTVGIAGLVAWARLLPRVEVALAHHYANVGTEE
jgi:hypothetical protein